MATITKSNPALVERLEAKFFPLVDIATICSQFGVSSDWIYRVLKRDLADMRDLFAPKIPGDRSGTKVRFNLQLWRIWFHCQGDITQPPVQRAIESYLASLPQ
jgi:hypothetical protein